MLTLYNIVYFNYTALCGNVQSNAKTSVTGLLVDHVAHVLYSKCDERDLVINNRHCVYRVVTL
jgi:hypothetical protein